MYITFTSIRLLYRATFCTSSSLNHGKNTKQPLGEKRKKYCISTKTASLHSDITTLLYRVWQNSPTTVSRTGWDVWAQTLRYSSYNVHTTLQHTQPKPGLFTQLIRICYLSHAATAVSDKEGFPTAPLKSGMTYHFRSLNSLKRNLKTLYFANNWPPGDFLQTNNCSSVLTTDTAPVKRLYCCVTHFHFPAAFCCGCNLEVYRL